MKILLLTQNYPPDLGAGSFRMKALVDVLTSRNHQVVVITGTPNRYDTYNYKNDNYKNNKEMIVRIKVPPQKQKLLQRGLSYYGFYRKAKRKAKKLSKDCDVILATSPQLLVAYAGAKVAKKNKKPFILDVRDLWPDVMIDLNLATKKSFIYKILKKMEKKCYQQASKIVINSPAFAKPIKETSGKETTLIMNGIDDVFFEKIRKRNKEKPEKPYVITYAGNLGIAQDLKVLLKTAKEFKGNFLFRLIGDGSEKQKLLSIAEESEMDNIEFVDPVKREDLINYYEQTDAFFVHLKNVEMFKRTIPSKIFEYCATGKPVVYGLQGVSKKVMEELQGNKLSFETGNHKSLTGALKKLHRMLINKENWNHSGSIDKLENEYLRSTLSKKFADVIEETVN